MARTKVSLYLLHGEYVLADLSIVVVIVASKPPASPPEVTQFDLPDTLTCDSRSSFLGKAPRKQLATKAARKTAAVSAFVVVGIIVEDDAVKPLGYNC